MRRRTTLLLTIAMTAPAVDTQAADAIPSVGCEGRVVVVLPLAGLEAVPVTGRPTLLVRIAGAVPVTGGVRYDLRYQAALPGRFDLRECLQRPDGTRPDGLPALPVQVRGLLATPCTGDLTDAAAAMRPALGGYRLVMALVVAGWALLLIPLWRRRHPVVVAEIAPPPVGLDQRLAALVAAARNRSLDADGLAALERMLIAWWRERLALTGLDAHAALARLRTHPEAGMLLRQVETWLHARPDAGPAVDVDALLAPYRAPAPSVVAP